MVNKAIIVGRLGGDPKVKHTQNGSMVTNFSVATDMVIKDKTGEKEKKTEWHRIATFGRLAEICEKYLQKGSLVYIEGWLRTTSWEKDGHRFNATDIVAQSMKMLGGFKKHDDAPNSGDADEDVPF